MTSRTLPGLSLSAFWALGEDGWKTGMDNNIRTLSAVANGAVKSRVTPLPGSPSLGDIYIVPSGAGSNPNKIAIWDGEVGSEAWVYLTPITGLSLFVIDESKEYRWVGAAWTEVVTGITDAPSDGTPYSRQDAAWVVASTSGGAYDFGIAFGGTPTSSEVMGRLSLPRATTCPANFAGSAGHVGANPTAAFDIDVQDDGASIGTISIATDGSYTFATAGGVEIVIDAGSLVTFVAPVSVDATIVDINATLIGNV